ncbi:MAG: hypothetical protein PHY05_05700, partial [Methanothrix sp.]|nr:hypothetical protein [Methanothrix sp.]
MRFMVLFIASLVLLGIVFAGTATCKSDNANPLAPGQQLIKPGNVDEHSGAPGQTGYNPGQAKKTKDNLVESSSYNISYQEQTSSES